MADLRVEIVEIREVKPHPNADRLDIAQVFDFPVICKRGEYAPGDRAVYVPVDAVVPDLEEWRWLNNGQPLGKHARIRAKKLRGVFSMGLLVPANGHPMGADVAAEKGITKYEPEDPPAYGPRGMSTDSEKDPGFIPVYTSIDALRRYRHLLVDGEEVVVTEKIHGANARFCFHDGRFWAGSHRQFKKQDPTSMWWRAAEAIDLPGKLDREARGIVLYGEVYGQVQDLKYGAAPGVVRFRAFDAFRIADGRYLDFEDFDFLCAALHIEKCPLLFRGPWTPDLMALADGTTTVDGADHIREGFVVKPVRERWDAHLGRVILKHVGEAYHLRKGGSEGK